MSLFETEKFEVCPICHGSGHVWDDKIDADRPCKCQSQPDEDDDAPRDG